MSLQALPQTTAGIDPEKFADELFFARNRRVAVIILAVFLAVGFGSRIIDLGNESLSEDELNKLQTVEDYRENGLSAKNGEHPFLMKGMQTVSVIVVERLNNTISSPALKISDESAIRFPVALFGTFTILLLFLLVSELFGRSIGLISAIFWAIEPMAIGFDRIAKEDSLVLFFFLLTNLFWIRGQTAAERGNPKWLLYLWASAAGFAALMASKYYPHLLGITGAYYIIFQQIPGRKWELGKVRWLKFFIVMGLVFLVLNPTIMLPDTWREMVKFSGEHRIGHDSYEFMGQFYRNQVTVWLAGVPWTFYLVFIAVKTSLSTLALCLIGLPLMFRRKLGDGRFFIFFWAYFWFIPFSVLGGKFTRYFTVAEPLVLISAAVGFYFSAKWISSKLGENAMMAAAFQSILLVCVLAFPIYNSLAVSSHFRLFTNSIGTYFAPVGSYFPHDEFYDVSAREVVADIAARARPWAITACETPTLFEYYARKIGRDDLVFVSLSDPSAVGRLAEGDFVVSAGGRSYLSNVAYVEYLAGSTAPAAETQAMGVVSAQIYQLDANSVARLHAIAMQ